MVKNAKRLRVSTALSYEQKHTCRHCSYKSFTIVHMHEQTCDLNPNRAAYITKRYGPNHLTGSDISKLMEGHRRKLPVIDLSQPRGDGVIHPSEATRSVLLVLAFTVTPDLPALSQDDLDSVFKAL